LFDLVVVPEDESVCLFICWWQMMVIVNGEEWGLRKWRRRRHLFISPTKLACFLPSPTPTPNRRLSFFSIFLLGDGDASFRSFIFIFAFLPHYKSMN
jgi:hypothetical protein